MAGIAGPRGGASHSRLRRVADPYPSRMGEALWQSRLRWRLRGAMLWPAFVAAVVVEAVLLDRLPVSGDDGPGLFAAVLLAGFANLVVVAVAAPLAGRWLRRRRPGMPSVIATDRAGAVLRRRRRCAHRRPGPRAPPERAGRARRPRRPGGLGAALLHQPGAARVPGQRRPPRHHQAGRRPLPHLRRRPDPDRAFCVFVNTDQSPPGVTATPTSGRTPRWSARR